ncbi:uncharacterized protein LOC129204564 [Grus americana]|uniref:uncharacterized protein LOC129204564 n=1 Tax=Grus americana TaxID=9117 RepID=UPI002407CF24|nr:uncharacterized protein LOC129204564 [Grus americana]
MCPRAGRKQRARGLLSSAVAGKVAEGPGPEAGGARGAFSSSRRNWWWPSCSKTLGAPLPFPRPWPWERGRDSRAPAPGPGTLLLDAPVSGPRAGGGQGSVRGHPREATSISPPASPLCRRGTSVRPQLRLPLDQLWVLSGRKKVAWEEEGLEEEEGSNEDSTSLVFIWPTGSCVASFGSRALKELWLGTLLRTPEGAKRARVSRLPSLKLLQKELSRRHAWRTFSARSLERLLEGQAEAEPKQRPTTVPSNNEGMVSPGEFWKERQAPPASA